MSEVPYASRSVGEAETVSLVIGDDLPMAG